jgi:hypothetical protein
MSQRINARHRTAAHELDQYWTPPEAVSALMQIENLPVSIADPCVGSGAIVNVLKAAGHVVYGSDIMDYGWPCTVVRDYLAIWVSSRRLPMMHRVRWAGPISTSNHAFAWHVWDRKCAGDHCAGTEKSHTTVEVHWFDYLDLQ